MLRAIIFDFDGTVSDTEETHRQAFNTAFLYLGLGWDWTPAMYRGLLQTSGGAQRIARFIMGLGLRIAEQTRLLQLVPRIHAIKTDAYAGLITEGRCPLRPGVGRLFEEALNGRVKLAIASTTAVSNVMALLAEQLGTCALRQFDAVLSCQLVERMKPAPDIYCLALATLGMSADCCVALEDSGNGLAASKAAGLCTVVTPTSWTFGACFADADLHLSHLGDAARPLPRSQAAAVGAPWLGLEQLRALLAAGTTQGG